MYFKVYYVGYFKSVKMSMRAVNLMGVAAQSKRSCDEQVMDAELRKGSSILLLLIRMYATH